MEATPEMLAMIESEGDPVTKGWVREMARISAKSGPNVVLEPWEEILCDLTLEMQPTMLKRTEQWDSYDHFLFDILKLLVIPNPADPQADRDLAVSRLVERAKQARGFRRRGRR